MDMTNLVGLFTTGAIAIGMAIVGYFAQGLAARLVWPIATRFLEHGMAGFVVSIVRAAVLLFTLKLILDQTGAAGVLVILITAFTGAFALGSERIASDVVAGTNLFMLRYYKVGDLVTIGDRHGWITGISLTHTSLANEDRDRIIIPNSEILGQIIINHSGIPGSRLRASFQIEGAHDRDTVIKRILDAAQSFEPQLRGPDDQPSVILENVQFPDNPAKTLSTYVLRVYAPEKLYGKNDQLLLHVTRILDSQGYKLSPTAA